MTFIELVRAVRLRIGIQGSGPSSIDTTIPIEQQMIKAVYDAWVDLQNFRTDWRWMRGTDSFNTTAGTTTYSLSTIISPDHRWKKWRTDTFYVTENSQYKPLTYLEYDYFQYKHNNTTDRGKLSDFTVRPWDGAVILTPPNTVYSVKCDYQKRAQLLTANTSIPEIPVHHHLAIVYGALEKMGVAILSQEQYDHYSQQYAIALGQIMREYLPRKTMQQRPLA